MHIMGDNRCKKIDEHIVVTNYKCMFSSLTKLEGTRVTYEDLDHYDVIFIYRHPHIRLISCFLHWGIRSPKKNKVDQQGNVGGWLLQLFEDYDDFDLEEYKIKLNDSDNDETLIEIFKEFIEVLPNIFEKNKHLNEQIKIINDYNLNIDTYINSDTEEEVNYLENILNTTFRVCNKSDQNQKQLLYDFLKVNSYYLNIVNNIYNGDLELYNRINNV